MTRQPLVIYPNIIQWHSPVGCYTYRFAPSLSSTLYHKRVWTKDDQQGTQTIASSCLRQFNSHHFLFSLCHVTILRTKYIDKMCCESIDGSKVGRVECAASLQLASCWFHDTGRVENPRSGAGLDGARGWMGRPNLHRPDAATILFSLVRARCFPLACP